MIISTLQKAFRDWLGRFRPYNRVKTPTILQATETECGLAALAILFAWYHHPVPLEQLRDECGGGRDGSKAVALMRIAESHGFKAEAWSVDMDAIPALKEPVMAFWNFTHYVVINGAGNGKVFINDPAVGPMTVTLAECDRSFTGVMIKITPGNEMARLPQASPVKRIFAEVLSGCRRERLFLLGCLLLVACVPLVRSGIIKVLTDQVILSGHVDWTPYLALLGAGTMMVLVGFTALLKWHEYKYYTKIGLLRASRLLCHILSLPLLFYSLRQKSQMVAMVTRVEAFTAELCKSALSLVSSGLLWLVCLALMLAIDGCLGVISCCFALLSAGIMVLLSRLCLPHQIALAHDRGKYYAHTATTFANFETLKACRLERGVLSASLRYFCRKSNSDAKASYLAIAGKILDALIHSSCVLVLLCVGGMRIAEGSLSAGQWVAFYGVHLFFGGLSVKLLQALREGQSAFASGVRVRDILQVSPDPRFSVASHKQDIPRRFPVTTPLITCHDICFQYNRQAAPVLSDISFDIFKGQHVALVGGTGSGKSTLTRVLSGLYPSVSGRLWIAGTLIIDFSPVALARWVSYVSQEVSLFAGTLHDNLVFGNPRATESVIQEALELACLVPLVTERGLHAPVTDNGDNFSGGEKQRIEIARALIQQSPVLVLDEATSALDPDTECQLIANLRRLDRTIIFVAHRLSSIIHCDQIIVLKAGKIVEKGVHPELVLRQGEYRRLVEADPALARSALT